MRGLDPLSVLQRGYALVYDERGNLIDTIKKAVQGEEVAIHLSDGSLQAEVQNIIEKKQDKK